MNFWKLTIQNIDFPQIPSILGQVVNNTKIDRAGKLIEKVQNLSRVQFDLVLL